MRYRIRISRLQIAERTIRASDEDAAIEKIKEELRQPYGYLARWETVTTDIGVLAVESSVGGMPVAPSEGALLLSVAEAAKALDVSRGSLYELVNAGEVKRIQIGRRRHPIPEPTAPTTDLLIDALAGKGSRKTICGARGGT